MNDWNAKPVEAMSRKEIEYHLVFVHETETDLSTMSLLELRKYHDDDDPRYFVQHEHGYTDVLERPNLSELSDFELLNIIEPAPGPTEEYERAMAEAIHRAVRFAMESPEYAAMFSGHPIGPECVTQAGYGECSHPSCWEIRKNFEAVDFCREDGWQIVTESGGGKGFAGGAIYWDVLFCGHTMMDESDDVRAAQ